MGPTQYATRSAVCGILLLGEGLPNRAQIYRVPIDHFETAISYQYDRLEVVPGRTRLMCLDGVVLGPQAVLALNGETVGRLFDQYRKAFPVGLGEHSFRKLARVLTTKSKSLTGLSSYYIDFLHLERVVKGMLTRAIQSTAEAGQLPSSAAALPGRLEAYCEFLKYAYAHKHLSGLECDGTLLHCQRHALGSMCAVEHTEECAHCTEMATFIPSLLHFLAESQAASLTHIEGLFNRYQAHKLREWWQCNYLYRLFLAHASHPHHLHLVIDHKQKVLPVANRESQESYFGKKGRGTRRCACREGWGRGAM